MPAYEEKSPKWYLALLFILAAFAIIYNPMQLGDRELYWKECIYSVMALENNYLFPLTVAHGELIPGQFPMFPWMASFLYNIPGLSMELTLRVLSVASLAGVALLVWEAGRRALDIQAAAVGTAAMISFGIVIEKAMDGYPHFTALFFLFAGWLIWFTFGAARSSWSKAWIFSLFCCGLAFYTIGWAAIIYFFLPLIFMRRPLTVWPKLRKPGFFVGMFILLCFVLIWGIPRWAAGTDIPFRSLPLGAGIFEDYLTHVLLFPFDLALRFMPWTVIAWPPFCVAYFPIDKNPIFSRFLRTIFISLFFMFWFSPFTDSRDLILLAPPLAVLIAINYWLLVRRHGNVFRKLFQVLSIAAVLSGLFLLAFYLIPVEWWRDFYYPPRQLSFKAETWYYVLGIVLSSLIIAAGLYFMFLNKYFGKIWAQFLMASAVVMLFYWGLVNTYNAQNREKSDFGHLLKDSIADEHYSRDLYVYIYKDISYELYGESYYLGTKVKKIRSYDELPEERDVVFVISSAMPAFPDRIWESLLPQKIKTYKDSKISFYKGIKVKKEDDREESGKEKSQLK